MSNWDVIVVGLGGAGSSAAYHLSRTGLRVLGLDQYSPVHAFGSSHGMTRIIRQAYFEHASYVPLLRRAYELWDELERGFGVDRDPLFHRTGLVEMGPRDGVVIPGILQSANEHGLEVESIAADEIARRWPGLRADPEWSAVIEHDAGYLRVESCVAAHLAGARAASATLRHGEAVRSWKSSPRGVEIETDFGTESAAKLVIAAGPWSNQLLQDLGVSIRILRKHQYWYGPARGTEARSAYEEGNGFPCFFHETPAGFFYGFPSAGGRGVKVARHSGGQPVDRPTPTHPADARDRSLVEQYCREYLPLLGRNLIARTGCYYSVTPDEHFIVDRHPNQDHVIVMAGLSGHGFKFTSVLGELASRLATDKPMSVDATLLTFERRLLDR